MHSRSREKRLNGSCEIGMHVPTQVTDLAPLGTLVGILVLDDGQYPLGA